MKLLFSSVLLIYVAKNYVFCQSNTDYNSANKLDTREGLLLVQLIFRHGDRTPLSFYKNDPWKEAKFWEDEPGQLTNTGKQQLFDLGQYIHSNSKEIKEFNSKHKSLYDYLTVNSGDNVRKMSDVVPIRDTLMIETLHNRTLPEWAKNIFPGGNFYNSIEAAALEAFKVDTGTPLLAKLKGGFLLKDILDRFSNKSRSILDPDRKLWVYSGHDTTISRVLNTLGILESIPSYATCVMFEMRNVNGVPHIELFLKNSSMALPLHIPNCGLSCPLVILYDLYKNVLPTKSFEDECYVKNSKQQTAKANKNESKWMLYAAILSVVLLTKLLC